jgi:hypothetical protein
VDCATGGQLLPVMVKRGLTSQGGSEGDDADHFDGLGVCCCKSGWLNWNVAEAERESNAVM